MGKVSAAICPALGKVILGTDEKQRELGLWDAVSTTCYNIFITKTEEEAIKCIFRYQSAQTYSIRVILSNLTGGQTIFVSERSTEVRDWAVKSNSMLLIGYHQEKACPGAAQKQTKDHPCLSQSLILDSCCHTSHLDREHASSPSYRSDSTMVKRARSRPAVSIQWLLI